MKTNVVPKLYIKTGCPWCEEAIDYMEEHNLPFEKVTVTGSPSNMDEMIKISGQTKAPTMDWDGDVLADFGTDELEVFLKKHGIG
jgi:glutaredoxin